mgnify:CR=1 FL=1
MDVKQLYTLDAHEEGSEVQIKDPSTNEPTDFYIKVKGVDSRSYRDAVRKYHRKLLKDEEGGEIDLLVAVTIDWRGLKSGKDTVKFTEEAARNLYENAPNVASQVDRFIAERVNFTKG